MIRCVMFDLGHVLIPFDPQRFYDFARVHQPPGAIEPERCLGFACISRFDTGHITAEEFCFEMKKHLRLNVDEDEFWSHFCNIMEPDQKMVALKRALKENGFKLAVISNINQRHFEYAQTNYPEVFSDFDYLALSFRLYTKKPDPKMYSVPARELGVLPEECFLVDDIKINIEAFEQWGGTGHHFNVGDDGSCYNSRREIERNRLLLRMVSLGMLNLNQAGSVARVDF